MYFVDRKLFFACSILIIIGVIFSYSLSSFIVNRFGYGEFHFAIRQFFVGGIGGIGIMWILSRLNPDKIIFKNVTLIGFLGFGIFFISTIAMIVMQFLPSSIVPEIGGAKRWIKIFGFSISPVEFFKIGFTYFLAWSFTRKITDKINSLWIEFLTILPHFFVFLIAAGLVAFLQKDLGQTVVLGVILILLAKFAGLSKKLISIGFLIALVIGTCLIVFSQHRINRVKSWWVTNQDMVLAILPDYFDSILRIDYQDSFQISHAINAMHNGGLFGTWLGNGTFKLGFLSEVHTDFVLAGIAEEIGAIGLFAITGVLVFIVKRIFNISTRIENKVYHLFCLGMGLNISIGFLINALGVTAITPVKGITVPFLSYGGSSVLALCIGVGMVLMISKKAVLK